MAVAASHLRAHYEVGPVLLVTPWYRPTTGGVVEVAERLRRTLTQAGVQTHLLICDEENLLHRIEVDPAVPNIWRFHIASYLFYRFSFKAITAMLLRSPLALWRLLRFVRDQRVRTLLLIHPTPVAWPFLILRYLAGIRLIASYHGNDLLKYSHCSVLSRWIARCILRASHAITVPAGHLAQKAQEICPDRMLPIRLIPNCVNFHHFTPSPSDFTRSDARPTLVHISNFAPIKRTLDIIEAFANAAVPPTCRLIMVGDGPELKAAITHARRLKVEHRVEFVGKQHDVRPFLWQADLLVMASDAESGPLTLLEAMACEVPWIATAWGIATMIPLGECGLVVPGRKPQQLAAAMVELLNDPQRRRAMGKRGRQRVQMDFGEAEYVERHLQLIQEVEQGVADRKSVV